jgi:NitT/TauT family transport system substrate-binding protein
MPRVASSPLEPRKADFELMRDMMVETGILQRKIELTEYVDSRFADHARTQAAWSYAGLASRAE